VRKGSRDSSPIEWLRPDGKTQVSVIYEGDRPVSVGTVVLSTQHSERFGRRVLSQNTIKATMVSEVIRPVLEDLGFSSRRTKILVNPTGRFVIGGPHGDAGLTGRKIIVDTYGGMARHGGGAFSGKDPSKVDRSAAYAARWVAKNIVEAKLARRCEVQVAYAIGVAQPVSILVDTFGTGAIPDARLELIVREVFDLTPKGIIDALHLKRPIYQATAAYGHFGRRPKDATILKKRVRLFPWEETSRVRALLSAARV
jgi:S-adenosylmethionine synthetase